MEYHFRSLSHRAVGMLWFSVAVSAVLFAVVLVFYVLSPRYVEVKTLVSNVTVQRGQDVSVPVQVRNVASPELEKGANINLGGRWYNETGLVDEGVRLPAGPLAVGAATTFSFSVHAPEKPGRYTLRVDLVEEGSHWFGDSGDWPATVEVAVE